MAVEGLTIPQVARRLGLSTRTVRRFIKSGKIKAELTEGSYGPEYRIKELPEVLQKPQPLDNAPIQSHVPVMEIIRELQEKNLALAARLGAATERIRNLESQLKLPISTKKPWWQRLFQKGS